MENESTSKSTFLITSSKYEGFGTGFCIYKDEKGSYLLTAGHVVESCGREYLLVNAYESSSHIAKLKALKWSINDKKLTLIDFQYQFIEFSKNFKKQNIAYKAELFSISENTDIVDLALIYVKGLTETTALKISNEIREFNAKEDTFEISGFRPHKGLYANEPLKGYIKKAYPLQSKKGTTWVYDLIINREDTIVQGYSGSAIVCSLSGLVLGVATDRRKGGKQAYAIPAYYLKYIWKDMPSQEIVEPLEKNNPYKGLSSFEYKDKHNYYGREKESNEIAKVLKGTKLFTLLGASGSGKSSLIFAGTKPLIEEKNVKIVDFRPQDRPFKNLASIFTPLLYADRLEQISQNNKLSQKLLKNEIRLDDLVANLLEQTKIDHLYIVIDQFEELYTLSKEIKEINIFLDQLLTLINSQHSITLLISMRADFLSKLSYYEPFNQAFNDHKSTSLSLLSVENLQKVIEEPSKKLGVRFEEGLIDRIIDEIENEAGQLPLLEFALEQFWNKRKGRFITHKILDEMQSISHSIRHYANNIYDKHHKHQKSIKKVLIKLVNPGSGTEDTRRVASFDDFDKEELKTIQLLANERLVVTTDDSVDIVHEALLREWKRLKDWIDDYREFLVWEKKLRDDRVNYFSNLAKDDDKNLLTDSKLLRAKEFLESHEEYIAFKDKEFIEKSIEVDRKKRRNFKIALISGFLFLVGVIVVIWFFFKDAEWAKEEAVVAKVETQSKLYDNLVQQGLTHRDYLNNQIKSKLLFANAIEIAQNKVQINSAKVFYNSIFEKNVRLQSMHQVNTLKMNKIKSDEDKEWRLSWNKNIVKLRSGISNKIIYSLNHGDNIKGAIVSDDGRMILSWSDNKIAKLWSIDSKEVVHSLTHDSTIAGAVFRSDGQAILSWGNYSKVVKLWSIHSGQVIRTFKHDTLVRKAIFSMEGEYILSWANDENIKLWSIHSGQVVRIFKHQYVKGVIFNNNEKTILSWGADNRIKLWDFYSDKALFTLSHKGIIGAIFRSNTQEIFSWSANNIVQRWSIDSNKILKIPNQGIVFSQDKQKILSWGDDKEIRLWDINSNKLLRTFKDDNVSDVIFSPNGEHVLSWNNRSKSIKLWNIDSNKVVHILKHNSNVMRAVFRADGEGILSWSKNKMLQLWSIKSGKVLDTLKHDNYINKIKLSQYVDGILTWSFYDRKLKLWNFYTDTVIRYLQHKNQISEAIFSKDEQQILSWDLMGKRLKLWNMNSDKVVQTIEYDGQGYVKGAIFSEDGKNILYWTSEDIIKLWNIYREKVILTLEHNNISEAIFSKRGEKILAWNKNKVLKIWSINSDKVLRISKHKNFIKGSIFTEDGKHVFSWGDKGVEIYNLYGNIQVKAKYYPLKTQVETGAYLTPSGEVKALTKKEWETKKAKYEEILAETKD